MERPLAHLRGTERLVDYRRVMDILCCSRSKAYQLISMGYLGQVVQVGASRRVAESAVLAFRDCCTVDPLADDSKKMPA
ncbi:MAG: hypothetical protein KQJ78_20595 [Deltaproteobacteria bacterium]|nr:hypothetical protein [Deltaproteobacteria bacterium]